MMYYYRAELRDITLYAKLRLRNSFISLINHANLYLSVVEMHGDWIWRTHRCETFRGRGPFCTAFEGKINGRLLYLQPLGWRICF